MISIIIPIYILDENIKKLTEKCITSLHANTKGKYELIIIDNNSPIKVSIDCDSYVINKNNLGNAKAWNQGMGMARGEYILLSDNDVLFEEGWEEMTKHTDNSIVFPMTRIRDRKQHEPHIAGYFWMIDRKTYNDLGKVSEEYGIANFEDTDYFMTAQNKGYKLKCVSSAHVWHYGRATCEKVEEVASIFPKNEKHYLNKFHKFPTLNEVV